jgi:hypothetical protein
VGTLFSRAAASSLAPSAVNPNYKNAYLESYNLNYQQDLGAGTALQLGYVGSGGRHLRVTRNLNQYLYPNGVTPVRPYPTVSTASLINPGSSLGNISYIDYSSMSNYNALWLTVRKSMRGGLQLNSTYTYSKSMDENSQSGIGFQDSRNPSDNYGLSDFDVRHHFVFSGTWTVPLHGNRLKEGWLLANITQVQGGNPMNVVTTSTYPGSSGSVRPTLLGPYSTGRGAYVGRNVAYIQGSVCTTVVAGCSFYAQPLGFGNLRRNALKGPGFFDTDLSIQKTTKIAESVNLVLRLDSFDLLNNTNFANPNLTASTSGAFGLISSTRGIIGDAGSSRQLQFAGKITF